MPAVLGRFTKQPDECLDYDVSYADWFEDRSDAPASFTAAAETGITVEDSSLTGEVVRVVLSGGTDGVSYHITVLLTTDATPPVVKEADFIVKVKAV